MLRRHPASRGMVFVERTAMTFPLASAINEVSALPNPHPTLPYPSAPQTETTASLHLAAVRVC